jgi:hypothetical protein
MTKRLQPEERRRPEKSGFLVGVRFPPGDLAKLDRWIAAQPGIKPSRPAAVRMLLAERWRQAPAGRRVFASSADVAAYVATERAKGAKPTAEAPAKKRGRPRSRSG